MLTTKSTIDLDSHLPALFFTLSARLTQHAIRGSAKQLDLDMSEWRIIQIIGRMGPSSVIAIADSIAMDRGGTSRAISRLEARGIVSRSNDSKDRRRYTIDLTDEGWTIQSRIADFSNRREHELIAELSLSDVRDLTSCLKSLDEKLKVMLEEIGD